MSAIELPVTAHTSVFCPSCDMKSYAAVHDDVGDVKLMGMRIAKMMDEGWKGIIGHAGLVKQCAACAAKESSSE